MSIRLNVVTRDLNVGLSSIVGFLRKKGFTVEENPNAKISDDKYELLIKEFGKDKDDKLESVKSNKQPPAEKAKIVTEEKIFKIEVPIIESAIKVIGHIDLPPINQPTHPEKKDKEDKKQRNRIKREKINFSDEKEPMFIGDIPAFKKWINAHYSDALDSYITEDVIVINVNFNVDEKGHVKDVRAQNTKHLLLAAEAVRIVSLSPDWIPGIKNGIPSEMPQLFYLKFKK
ncbi:MAG: energy transducer TonB [Candidatus Symbiothrix sp.]|jgi:hypothetical protein|nr:energy transducer TonB [Candidatus Symbiothrix sp.]